MEYELIKDEEQDQYPVAPFLSFVRAQSTAKAERDADVGDIVHHWNGQTCQAAIVVGQSGDYTAPAVDVVTFSIAANDPFMGVVHSEEKKAGGTWHWPSGGH